MYSIQKFILSSIQFAPDTLCAADASTTTTHGAKLAQGGTVISLPTIVFQWSYLNSLANMLILV